PSTSTSCVVPLTLMAKAMTPSPLLSPSDDTDRLVDRTCCSAHAHSARGLQDAERVKRPFMIDGDRSDERDRDIDVAPCGFRIRTILMPFVAEALGDMARDPRQADVEPRAKIRAAIRAKEVPLGVDHRVCRQHYPSFFPRKPNRGFETSRPPRREQL